MYTRLRLVQQKLACLTVELPPVFERVELIPEFLQWATRPDGHAVPLGDTQSGPWSSLIPELVRTQSTRGGAHRPSGNHRIYRDGWAFYRSGWEGWERGEPAADSLLTVRYGTFRRIHGHRDHTSITWYSSGGTVIEDPGFSGYEDRNQRISEQGESSHNGVVLEGAGRFRWENGSPILRQSTSYFGTEHEPVHSLVVGGISYVEASRIRSIVHVPSRQIVIVHDVVNAKCDVSASTRWLLSPDFTISDSHCDDRQVGFRDGDRELVVRVLQKDVEVEVSGAQDGSAGRIATDLGTFRTCPVIKTGATGREPEMTAVFSLERGLAVEEIGGARMGWSLRFPDGEAVQILRAGDIGLNVEVTRPLLTRKYDHLG
nr:heparinase II/III family protein [Corynebacterium meridianum]